ncbi:MAG: undecaprenyl-diphosphate phosphatase [Nitrospirota bacterium]
MEIFDSIILGILQGITEFLPISSSGHLVLGEYYLSLNVEMLKSFDVVVHIGTLLAIFVYFWKDIWGMLKAIGRLFVGRLKLKDPYARLIFFIIIGTIPAVIIGLFFEDLIDSTFRNVKSVGAWMMVVGIVFVIGEYTYRRVYCDAGIGQKIAEKADNVRDYVQPGGYESPEVRGMKWWKAIVIGLAQALALIPGVSRSGSTIVAGLFQGINRSAAARFSFLLGIPAMAGAGFLTALKIPENGGLMVDIWPLFIGFFTSFIFGLLSVAFLMRFLKKNSLIVFAIYLIALGFGVFI